MSDLSHLIDDADRWSGAPATAAAKPGRSPTILVVEDDDLHFEVLGALLAKTGSRVIRETTLSGARAHLEQEAVDLVVSDLLVCDGLPDTSLRTLIDLPASAPIIVVTSWSGQIASHMLTGGSRLKLFDKNNFDYGLFLATVEYLLASDGAEPGNPFNK